MDKLTESGQADALRINCADLFQKGHSGIRQPLNIDIEQDNVFDINLLLNRGDQTSLGLDVHVRETPALYPPQAAVDDAVSALLEVGERLSQQRAVLLSSFESRYLP